MKFENTQVWGFEHAIRGMRNPKESWDKSDSYYDGDEFILGPQDLKLAQTLIKGGPEHRKFLRQIFVSVDITAPLYWWKEFDTYKVGTVANSTSTMHKMASKPITLDCFEIDDFRNLQFQLGAQRPELKYPIDPDFVQMALIPYLEYLRTEHLYYKNEEKEAREKGNTLYAESMEYNAYIYWKELIRWLPEGWLQTRTVTMTYENLLAMCSKGQRRFHKLNEWSGKRNPEHPNFIKWARSLSNAQNLIFIDELNS